ncbi:Adaptin N terminal region family protein [Histomonas meleagridis]|uniref:Adaptin N terminal region family protein n=1 Tax=Histomonas meleagridis TaxID=135588 RepID=UPI003559D21C|nr:Adaptin N terminal region family protein [Histomonas meleagridis]KAH0801009.1 Adaptin N terminal region family protein [Histomonas meleagridis]
MHEALSKINQFFVRDMPNDVRTLRNYIDSGSPEERKIAIKKVINLMRAGENVQVFFSSILQCVKTSDMELKRLIYLYLVHYSLFEPEQSILTVNTFILDAQDPNPLVRALAVRSMCRIRVESVAEYMVSPLKQSLEDPDPYVRKTAVLGVVKLYDIIPETVENSELFKALISHLNDDNPLVVSNTAAAIYEINERRTTPIFTFDSKSIEPLIHSISSSNEWCQTVLFDCLSRYIPESSEIANSLIERLIPYLKSSNPSVIIGAFRCIFLYMDHDKRDPVSIFEQILPSFLSLISSADPEIQYVVLRAMSLFVLKYPKALSRHIRFFFCKYNDPSFIKMQKLDIIVTTVQPITAQAVLDEFTEYVNSVDVSFVRKTIRCIGQIAIKLPVATSRCVDILCSCITSKASYAIEESIIVFCDILRRHPGSFESVLSTICSSLDKISLPEAKASAIWLLGEYSNIIENVDLLIDPFLDSFHDSEPLVQLQMLTSLAKIYLIKPEETKDQLQFVLNEATKETSIPDVRNRALLYWRLLSSDNEVAKQIIIFEKNMNQDIKPKFEEEVLTELIENTGNVAGVLHILPTEFVHRAKYIPDIDEYDKSKERLKNWTPLKVSDDTLISMFIDFYVDQMNLKIVNKSHNTLSNFAIAINNNLLGIVLKDQISLPEKLEFGESVEIETEIEVDKSKAGNFDKTKFELALRTNIENIFAICRLPIEIALTNDGDIGVDDFNNYFSQFYNSITFDLNGLQIASKETLFERKVYVKGKNGNSLYVSFALSSDIIFVGEIVETQANVRITVKSSCARQYLEVIKESAQNLFGKYE